MQSVEFIASGASVQPTQPYQGSTSRKFPILPDVSDTSDPPVESPYHPEELLPGEVTPALPEQVTYEPTMVDAANYTDVKAGHPENHRIHNTYTDGLAHEWSGDEAMQIQNALPTYVPREGREKLWRTIFAFVRQHKSPREPLSLFDLDQFYRIISDVLMKDWRTKSPFGRGDPEALPSGYPPSRQFSRFGARRNSTRVPFKRSGFAGRRRFEPRDSLSGSFTRPRPVQPFTAFNGGIGGQTNIYSRGQPYGDSGSGSKYETLFGGQFNPLGHKPHQELTRQSPIPFMA